MHCLYNVANCDGVSVDEDNRVVGLFLGGYGLTGQLPPEIGDLINLKWLYLERIGANQFTGCVPRILKPKLDDDYRTRPPICP